MAGPLNILGEKVGVRPEGQKIMEFASFHSEKSSLGPLAQLPNFLCRNGSVYSSRNAPVAHLEKFNVLFVMNSASGGPGTSS